MLMLLCFYPFVNFFFTWETGYWTRAIQRFALFDLFLSGIVFVVDSADKEGLPEAKEELHTILNNNKLAGVPLMIMANKQDLQGNSYHLHYIIYTS